MVTQWTADPHHARNRGPRRGLPNPGGPHRNPRYAANGRPLRPTRSVRRVGGWGSPQPRVPYRSDAMTTRPPDTHPGSAPTTAASTGHRDRSGKPRHRRRSSVVGHPGNRLHRLLGRAGGDPAPRRPRRRRDQSRGCSPAGWHAVSGGRPPSVRAGGGSGARCSCPATTTSAASASKGADRTGHRLGIDRRERSRHGELLAEGDGKLRSRLGGRGGREPRCGDGPDAGVWSGRPVAGPGRLCTRWNR